MVFPGGVHNLKAFESPWKCLKRSHLPLIGFFSNNLSSFWLVLCIPSLAKAKALLRMNEMPTCWLLMNEEASKGMASVAGCC